MISKLIVAAVWLVVFQGCLMAENWPAWRGPRGDGTSLETSLPTKWSSTNNLKNPTQSYSAPLIAKTTGHDQLIIAGNKAVSSYDPRTGKMLWVADGPSEDFVATPVYNAAANLVLSGSSWPKRILVAIRPDGEGNVTQIKLAWSTPDGAPYVPSPISVGNWFFTSGYATKEAFCFEAASGKILWHGKMGLHHASPVTANGLIYFLNDDGVAHIVKAGPDFELVARNELGEKTYASPALSGGQIFLRSFRNLYFIGDQAK